MDADRIRNLTAIRVDPVNLWSIPNGTGLRFVLQGARARARGLFLVRPKRGDIPVALLCLVSRTMKREGQKCPSSLPQEKGGARSSGPGAELDGDLF